jgi:hypothetical protein
LKDQALAVKPDKYTFLYSAVPARRSHRSSNGNVQNTSHDFPWSVDALPYAERAAQNAPVIVVFGLFPAPAAVTLECHIFFLGILLLNTLLFVTPTAVSRAHVLVTYCRGKLKGYSAGGRR